MKLNWGTSIVIAFVAFIAFIMYFVIIASSDNRADHDLVTEEYYKEELVYQKEINAMANAQPFKSKFIYTRQDNGLAVEFPTDIECDILNGRVSLYRPSNKHLDFDLTLSESERHLLIPDKRLLEGRWDMKIYWNCGEKEYLVKRSITY